MCVCEDIGTENGSSFVDGARCEKEVKLVSSGRIPLLVLISQSSTCTFEANVLRWYRIVLNR
jgi:hypothetical protein